MSLPAVRINYNERQLVELPFGKPIGNTLCMERISDDSSARAWLSLSAVVLVLSNLVPVYGVLFWHWEVFPIVFLFWAETVVIGVINVPKMLVVRDPTVGWVRRISTTISFVLQYGIFMAGLGFAM